MAGELTDRTLNFGPSRSHRVIEVVETVLALWPNNAGWVEKKSAEPEAQVLELDSNPAGRRRGIVELKFLAGEDKGFG